MPTRNGSHDQSQVSEYTANQLCPVPLPSLKFRISVANQHDWYLSSEPVDLGSVRGTAVFEVLSCNATEYHLITMVSACLLGLV